MDDDPTELAIIGGGPAGAALACLAARDGIETTVFERSAGPNDKVCGDFLSGETAHYLARLGLSPAALGAVPLARVRLSSGRRTAETPLPFEAWSLPRRVLDEALLAAAARAGAAVRRGSARAGRSSDRARPGRSGSTTAACGTPRRPCSRPASTTSAAGSGRRAAIPAWSA